MVDMRRARWLTNENILRLHVPMYDFVVVQVVQRTDKLLRNVLNDRFGQALVILENLKQLSCSINIVSHLMRGRTRTQHWP